jgi:fatty acid desaturase
LKSRFHIAISDGRVQQHARWKRWLTTAFAALVLAAILIVAFVIGSVIALTLLGLVAIALIAAIVRRRWPNRSNRANGSRYFGN